MSSVSLLFVRYADSKHEIPLVLLPYGQKFWLIGSFEGYPSIFLLPKIYPAIPPNAIISSIR